MNDGGGGGEDLRSCWNILRLGKFGVTTYPLRKAKETKDQVRNRMGRMGWDRCNRQSINSKLKLKMICLKADEPVEDLLVAFFCHTGSGQAL